MAMLNKLFKFEFERAGGTGKEPFFFFTFTRGWETGKEPIDVHARYREGGVVGCLVGWFVGWFEREKRLIPFWLTHSYVGARQNITKSA